MDGTFCAVSNKLNSYKGLRINTKNTSITYGCDSREQHMGNSMVSHGEARTQYRAARDFLISI